MVNDNRVKMVSWFLQLMDLFSLRLTKILEMNCHCFKSLKLAFVVKTLNLFLITVRSFVRDGLIVS